LAFNIGTMFMLRST